MEMRIAHLNFIQAIITRMASNSFLLKGWSVTLVAAMFALSAKDTDHNFILLAYFPVIVFWALDSYFLRLEKLYRELYEEVVEGRVSSDKLTLKPLFSTTKVPNIFKLAFTNTLLLFHGTIASVVFFAMFFIL